MARNERTYFTNIITLLYITSSLKLSNQSCLVNTWCRPLGSPSFPPAEYKFVVFNNTGRMNWFQALHLCRNEGNNSELLSIVSADEREWVVREVHSATVRDYGEDGDYSFYVNAHKYLYSTRYAAWSNSRAIDAVIDRESGFYFISKSKSYCGSSSDVITVADECFSLQFETPHGGNTNEARTWKLDNIACTDEQSVKHQGEHQGAICKRPLQQHFQQSDSSQTGVFNKSEWIPSLDDNNLYYRIVNFDQNCRGSPNWYCARLVCSNLEASLTDIVSQRENDWLVGQIGISYRQEGLNSDAFYFIDLHRLLYSNKWTWGGPRQNSSFPVSLPSALSHEHCNKLCAAIKYPDSIRSVHCGVKLPQARAVCKKYVSQVTTRATSRVNQLATTLTHQTLQALTTSTSTTPAKPEASATTSAPDWSERLEMQLAEVPRSIILIGWCVTVIAMPLCFAVFCLFCWAIRCARDRSKNSRGNANEHEGIEPEGQTGPRGDNYYEVPLQTYVNVPRNTPDMATYAAIQ